MKTLNEVAKCEPKSGVTARVGDAPSVSLHEPRIERLHRRLLETTAELCAAKGYRRIVLAGTEQDLAPIVRQPWGWHNVRVVGVVLPLRDSGTLRGVPVIGPDSIPAGTGAIVICSERDEQTLRNRFAGRNAGGIPVMRVHYEQPTWEEPEVAIARLTSEWEVPQEEAVWLVEHRAERHDATLPMLLSRRTELHLRRYEFASAHTRGLRVADVACGTGYGSEMLTTEGAAATVIGIDVDSQAVAYAQRKFGRANVTFKVADGSKTGLAERSVDVVTSFETIEHVPDPRALLDEFARVLTTARGDRGGKLVLSTPNDWGLTEHHVHSFTPETLRELLQERFTIDGWWSQLDSSKFREGAAGLPEGIAPMNSFAEAAETVLVVATVRG